MAELTIELSRDGPGKRFVVRIGYRADTDSTPFEHEILHRGLVTHLFPGLEITERRDAPIRTEREKPAQEPAVG